MLVHVCKCQRRHQESDSTATTSSVFYCIWYCIITCYGIVTHSFILRKEEAPVCVACDVVLTVKHILLECADLLDIKKKYFEEKSLYSLFRNVIPEVIFDFLREIGVFYKI